MIIKLLPTVALLSISAWEGGMMGLTMCAIYLGVAICAVWGIK